MGSGGAWELENVSMCRREHAWARWGRGFTARARFSFARVAGLRGCIRGSGLWGSPACRSAGGAEEHPAVATAVDARRVRRPGQRGGADDEDVDGRVGAEARAGVRQFNREHAEQDGQQDLRDHEHGHAVECGAEQAAGSCGLAIHGLMVRPFQRVPEERGSPAPGAEALGVARDAANQAVPCAEGATGAGLLSAEG